MIRRRYFTPLIAKELRELGPLWLVSLGGILALTVLPGLRMNPIAAAIYSLVAVALGAMSIGHEYRLGTLATLLAQPVHRGHLLAVKASVLVVMLGALAMTVWAIGGSASPLSRSIGADLFRSDNWLLLPVLCALCLAPWFTMLCRSELAGMVFAGAVPALLLIGGRIAALLVYGMAPDRINDATALTWTIVDIGVLVACVTGVVAGIRTFMKLEVTEGRDASNPRPPAWRRIVRVARPPLPARTANPYAALVRKELRLHYLPAVVAGLFTAGWFAISLSGEAANARIDLDALRGGLTALYVGIVALLTGSIASAEERRWGTLPLQLLMPVAMWKQWTVKVVTVLVVTMVLAIILPSLLQSLETDSPVLFPKWPYYLLLFVPGCLILGLYISSVSPSGLSAFLLSMGTLLLFQVAALFSFDLLRRPVSWWLAGVVSYVEPTERLMWIAKALNWGAFLASIVVLILMLRFAMINHGTLDRSARAVRRQLRWVGAGLIVALMTQVASGAFFEAALRSHRVRTAAVDAPYSSFSATFGSTFDARRAGR